MAGLPLIQHHIEACASLKDLREILIIGFYLPTQIEPFINEVTARYNVNIKYEIFISSYENNTHSLVIRYLQEFTALGTAGGLYHFRDQIGFGSPDAFFVMNGDVCADFPLGELYEFHKTKGNSAMVSTFF